MRIRPRKAIAAIAVVITAGLLSLALARAIFCWATLHVPRKLGRTPPNAATVSVIARDNVHLNAWGLEPSKPNGNCVIVLHDIADSLAGSAGFAPMFLSQGYAVLLPDSRAHGTSGGQ